MAVSNREHRLAEDYRKAAVRYCKLHGAQSVRAAHEMLDDLNRREPTHFAAIWWACYDSSYQTGRFAQELRAADGKDYTLMPIEHLDTFNEAVAIIEHRSDVEIERRHLEAMVEMVEAREAQILTLRNLLTEALPFVRQSCAGGFVTETANRITNVLATTWPTKDLTA